MNETLIYGLIAIALFAVVGLGIKVTMNFRSGDKFIMKNIKADGDVTGRDKIIREKSSNEESN